ncbi:MAG TPA: rRNA maturation RNase YbeY [Solirubrobacteraceae bacterium]|nr:rRNA maturation RNase YbeY [Solirubrobacteraceae bacterium]
MLEVEVLGSRLLPDGPEPDEVRRLCAVAAARRGVGDGHVAVEFVDAARIAALNAAHRGLAGPTDVLSFPIDGVAATNDSSEPPSPVPRELGDVVICPDHASDVREAIVHGMLHLLGMDHEIDQGEMLALQDELLAGPRR